MMKSGFISFLFVPTFLADFESDLKKVLEIHGEFCIPECTFNYSEITSKTIKYFPKTCLDYCGLIALNENLDLTPKQLKEVFKDMRWLNGGLRIENTNLKNLNFLLWNDHNPYWIIEPVTGITCPEFGTQIINNTELTDLKFFKDLTIWGGGGVGKLQFVNNTKADASGICESDFFQNSFDLIVDGNLKDCGCRYHQLAPNSPKANCTELYQPLSLDNISDPSTIYDSSKVERFHGDFSIEGSNFQNLSFFSSLHTIKTVGVYDSNKYALNLKNNPQMTRLAFPSLIILENIELFQILIINFENLHPDFCLTVQELVFFMNQYRTFENLHSKICDYNGEPIVQSKLCVFKDMASLDNDCIRIFGNLVIRAGDEKHVEKLKEVIGVIGSITIQSTELENLSCLGKVRYIVSLHETLPAVALLGNKNLKSLADLSEHLDIWTNRNRFCVIQGNHPDLIKPEESCNLFTPFLGMRNMTYLGDQCGQIYYDENNKTIGLGVDSGQAMVEASWIFYFCKFVFIMYFSLF